MKNLFKVKLPAAVALLCLASYVAFLEVQASDETDEDINSSAVWNPTEQELKLAEQDCLGLTGDDYTVCFTDNMDELGASPEAVDFTQEYADENPGAIAILRSFHPVDEVDLGQVFFPLEKHQGQHWVLLNGLPEIISLNDPKFISHGDLQQNADYMKLRASHPGLEIAFAPAKPLAKKATDGGQSFLVSYPLAEACSGCKPVGEAKYSFDFDAAGEFQGAKLVKVIPR
jgi:hypothetical protein